MANELVTQNTTDMNLNAGDEAREMGRTVTLDAGDNDIFYGGAVKFDGSGNITHTTANADDFIGVVLPQSDEKSDSKYSVHIAGQVIAVPLASDGTASPGDTLIPSGTDNGTFDGVASGMTANTGDADTSVYSNHPFALETGGNDEVILACMR
jgi:hypothetical protein